MEKYLLSYFRTKTLYFWSHLIYAVLVGLIFFQTNIYIILALTSSFGIILNMKRRGLILTDDHYYYLIDAYCKCGSVILANQILQEMKKLNLKPNSKIFGTIICAYLEYSHNTRLISMVSGLYRNSSKSNILIHFAVGNR